MWPDDYGVWEQRARRKLLQDLQNAFQTLLSGAAAPLRAEVPDLAAEVMHEVLNQAYDLRRYPEYFQDEAEFRHWLTVVGLYRTMRVFLRHGPVRRPLNLLPEGQRRVLGMVYFDRLTYSDLAGILGTNPAEVSRRRQEALDALRQLL